MAGACQLENTGSIRKSPEVGQAFESLQLDALHGYRFYFLNQENNPFGVAGLQKEYWMQGPDWKEVNPDSPTFSKVVGLVQFFRKYGDQYGMDWMLMAAQGYQESRLDQNAKSPVGAIGVMQVMPATGRELGVGDIRQTEPNINAGVKYIRFMVDQYFKNEAMDDLNKGLFAFASYNAGPGRIRQLRKEASNQGLDPNVWFNNVELVAAQKIGRETVTYVSNIYKYYIAYKLVRQEYLERREAKEEFQKQ